MSGQVSTTGTHPLAVYQPAWRSPFDMTAHATEIDLLESVQPVNSAGGIWTVHKESCTVDVLLHHRDTRPLAADASRCLLLWREAATVPALTGLDISALAPFVVQCAGGTVPAAIPGGWRIAGPGAGAAESSLGLPLDARIPRAVSFDVSFAGPVAPVPDQHFVMFLAFAWSTADQLGVVPSLPTTGTPTVTDLVRGWPYAAMRIVQVIPRPVPLP